MEPAEVARNSLLDFLLALLCQVLPSGIQFLVGGVAVEKNDAAPVVEHAANGVLQLHFIVFELENAGEAFERDASRSRMMDGVALGKIL